MEDKKTPYTESYHSKNKAKFNSKDNLRGKTLNREIKEITKTIEKKVVDEVKKVEKLGVDELRKLEETLNSKKARKIEKYIIIGLYLLVLGVAAYFLLANIFPNNPLNTSGVYSLDAGDLSMTSQLKSLYIDKDRMLGGKWEGDGKTLRLIVSEEPFNFVFNPKKVVAENTSGMLELSFVKVEGPSTEVYLNDRLIVPDLEGYSKVQEFGSEGGSEWNEVWVKDDLVKQNYVALDDAENFIYENFPGYNIYSFAELNGGAPIISDYRQVETRIDTQFRDNLKLAVYAEGDLDIEFTKQDLNSYIGADEYTIEVTDFQGVSYFNEIYEDDGEKKDSGISDEEQDFEINLKNLPRNVYYVSFVKDKNNNAADSTIKNIRVNSNKVLIIGNSLPLDEFSFYTEVNSPKKIGFYYWWTGKEQKIEQTGVEKNTINLNKDWLSKKYEQELNENGDYYFKIETGYLWIYADIISPSKENWFYLPSSSDSKLIDSDIIIIDKNKLQINEDEIIYKESIEITKDSKFKIQVLDKAQIYFEKIKLSLEDENEKTGLRVL